jgi:hypothetical protein
MVTPRPALVRFLLLAAAALFGSGCYSPYHADRGALFGGATGAGVGAVVGNAVGNTAAGALIGGGVGALTGAAIGQGMDDIEARNRAEIAATLGRQVAPGAVTVDDVLAMTRAGVNDELIASHVRANGVARPLTPQDLILLQNAGVAIPVIQTMQAPPQPVAQQPVAVYPAPVYAYPAYYPPPRVGWGVSYSTCR